MVIELTAFGIAKDILGSRRIKLTIPAPCTVGSLKTYLLAEFPALQTIKHFSIALGDTYAIDNEEIKEGRTVTILPPVSGG
jgi:molybdopterin converting factor small subunit